MAMYGGAKTVRAETTRALFFEDHEAVSSAAAGMVAKALEGNPEAVLLLPTGSTPLGMYRRLVALHREEGLSFARATFFNLDEYLGLSPDHPASYRAYMEQNFYGLVDADPARVHLPDGATPDPNAECQRYEAAIEKAGDADLCVLGIGRNGHVGFNEPGTPIDSRTRVVQLSETTRRQNAANFDHGETPEGAITVGLQTIMRSRAVMLVASGEGKARALVAALEGPVSAALPASVLRRHPDVAFLIDREAASALERVAV